MKKAKTAIVFLLCTLIFTQSSVIFNTHSSASSSAIVSGGIYYIKNTRTGKYLTASASTSGSSVTMQNFSAGSLQKFKLSSAGISNGYTYYNILLNANTGVRLDVNNASDSNGATIKLFTNNSSYSQAQLFRFIVKTPSYNQTSYRIMPKLSTTRVFSIPASSIGTGSNVTLYTTGSSSYSQEWILERTSEDISVVGKTKINAQYNNDTCGCACVRNILSSFGLTYSESTIKDRASTIASKGGGDYTYVYVLTDTINYFLGTNNKSVTYSYEYTGSYAADAYAIFLALEVSSGYPVMFNGNFSSNSYVPYSSTGHYSLVVGYKSTSSIQTAITADPYKVNSTTYAGIWEMPISVIKTTNQAHSSGGYIIGAEITV
jgi:hypothetical protein